MSIITAILTKLGFKGKTLDKAIAQMSKLHDYLESVEAKEKANVVALEAKVQAALTKSSIAAAAADRAARIRERAKEFIA